MKKLGLNELFGGLITGIIAAMIFTPSKPTVAPPKEECYTPQCLYEKCVSLGYPEEWCRSTYLPEKIIIPPAPPPEYPPVVVPAVTYVLTIQAGPGGSTVPVPGTYSPMAHDAVVLITAVPNSGYVFDHWTVNGEVRSENPIGWEESTEDITLIAYFTAVAAPAVPSTTTTTVEGVAVAVTTTPVSPSTSPATGNTVTGVVTSSKSGQIAEVQVSPVGQEVIFPTQISRYVEGTAIPAGSSLHTEGGVTYVVPTETISGTTQPITVSKYDPMTNTWVNVV